MWGFLDVSRESLFLFSFSKSFFVFVFFFLVTIVLVWEREQDLCYGYVVDVVAGICGAGQGLLFQVVQAGNFNWNMPGSCSVIPRVLGHVLLFPDCQIDF